MDNKVIIPSEQVSTSRRAACGEIRKSLEGISDTLNRMSQIVKELREDEQANLRRLRARRLARSGS